MRAPGWRASVVVSIGPFQRPASWLAAAGVGVGRLRAYTVMVCCSFSFVVAHAARPRGLGQPRGVQASGCKQEAFGFVAGVAIFDLGVDILPSLKEGDSGC